MPMIRGEDYWQCKCGNVSLMNYHSQILPNVCKACERLQNGTKPFEHSPRHGFKCDKRPTRSYPPWGGSRPVHGKQDYGPILDCVYEMADDISTSNGVSPEAAIDSVLRSEGWKILPTHRTQILQRLNS